VAADPPRQNGDWDGGETGLRASLPWSRPAQAVAAVLWPSFLAASFATMLFFAYVDPELLGHATSPALEVSRMTGYGIGFFFFWLITMVSSAISVYLLQTGHTSHGEQRARAERRE
jgi:hypothetical protein